MPGIDMYSTAARISPPDHFSSATMDSKRVNGMLNGTASLARSSPDEKLHIDDGRLTGFPHEMPPDIIHISHGFFPFTWLISRVTQQCWNDLSDLLARRRNRSFDGVKQASVREGGRKPVGRAQAQETKTLGVLPGKKSGIYQAPCFVELEPTSRGSQQTRRFAGFYSYALRLI
jgi:hypothetical protein